MLLYQILSSTMHLKIHKKVIQKYDFKMSLPTWNDNCKLPDGLDIQDYFEYIIKKMKHWLISHRYEYISMRLKTKLHSKKSHKKAAQSNEFKNIWTNVE